MGENSKNFLNLYGKNFERRVCVHRKQGFFLSVFVDDINIAGKKQNIAITWKNCSKFVDVDEPTSFVHQVYLGCTQRECKANETIIKLYTTMFESRVSLGAAKNYLVQETHAQTVAWSYDMEGHALECVERQCELASKKVEQQRGTDSAPRRICFQHRCGLATSVLCPTPSSTPLTRPRPRSTLLPRPLYVRNVAAFAATASS